MDEGVKTKKVFAAMADRSLLPLPSSPLGQEREETFLSFFFCRESRGLGYPFTSYEAS